MNMPILYLKPTRLVRFLQCTVLIHWNNIQRVIMSVRMDTFSWFWTNHSLLFLLSPQNLAEKQHMLIS